MLALLLAAAMAAPTAAKKPPKDKPTGPPMATDIGEQFRWGLGIEIGYPTSVTARYIGTKRSAVSAHVGSLLIRLGLHLRVQYELTPVTLSTFRTGRADLYIPMSIGVDLFFDGDPARLGIGIGMGAEIKLAMVPVGIFLEAQPVVYPLEATRPANLRGGYVGVNAGVGARWYF